MGNRQYCNFYLEMLQLNSDLKIRKSISLYHALEESVVLFRQILRLLQLAHLSSCHQL